jgi:hypothetical protein
MTRPNQAVSLDELIAAMFFVSGDSNLGTAAYLHLPSGEIYWQSDNELVREFYDGADPPADMDNSPDYLPIPNKADVNAGKALVFAFVAQFVPYAYSEVAAMFRKSKPYQRFREMLEARDLLVSWEQFRDAGQKEAMRKWCRKNDVIFRE